MISRGIEAIVLASCDSLLLVQLPFGATLVLAVISFVVSFVRSCLLLSVSVSVLYRIGVLCILAIREGSVLGVWSFAAFQGFLIECKQLHLEKP